RLRFARRDDVLGPHPTHARAAADRTGHLGEDVERETVARMLERSVPCRIDRLEALALELGALDPLDLDEDGSALDADPLGRHADPHIAGPHDLLTDAHPFRIGIDAAAEVDPLDDYGATEPI